MSFDMFLQQSILYWLDKCNELSYQHPFCQVLSSDGFQIVHISKHNAFEQGKDIIAINPKGVPCAFQLKGGNITQRVWNDIRGEIHDLIDYPIKHPSIPDNSIHISYLVTNGEIEDSVRVGIKDMNNSKWKNTPLITICRGQLLKMFLAAMSDFTATSVSDYKTFLDLMLDDSHAFIDEIKYSIFVQDVLNVVGDKVTASQLKRNINYAILLSGYVIGSYRKNDNHIACIQVLAILAISILYVVEKAKLKESYWLEQFNRVMNEIHDVSFLLQKDIEADAFGSMSVSPYDSHLAVIRRHIACSCIFAYKISQWLIYKSESYDLVNPSFHPHLKDSLAYYGESMLNRTLLQFWYCYILYGDRQETYDILKAAIKLLGIRNAPDSENALFSPYYNIHMLLEHVFGISQEQVFENFDGSSYLMRPLVDLLVRHGRRDVLSGVWSGVSRIRQLWFEPLFAEGYLRSHCEEGTNVTAMPKLTGSWAELNANIKDYDFTYLPEIMKRCPAIMPYVMLMYPQRCTPVLVSYMDDVIQNRVKMLKEEMDKVTEKEG